MTLNWLQIQMIWNKVELIGNRNVLELIWNYSELFFEFIQNDNLNFSPLGGFPKFSIGLCPSVFGWRLVAGATPCSSSQTGMLTGRIAPHFLLLLLTPLAFSLHFRNPTHVLPALLPHVRGLPAPPEKRAVKPGMLRLIIKRFIFRVKNSILKKLLLVVYLQVIFSYLKYTR